MGKKAQTFEAPLVGKGKPGSLGQLIVRAEAVKSSNFFLSFRLQGMSLPNLDKSCCGMCKQIIPVRYEWHKSSPKDLNHFTKVFGSTSIGATHNPHWPAEKYNIGTLCNSDEDCIIRIYVYSAHRTLGYCQSTLKDLKKNPTMKFMGNQKREGG